LAIHVVRKGLDLPLAGEPVQHVDEERGTSRVALVADDYPGVKPRLEVQPGDTVVRCQPLFVDRASGVVFVAPGSGTVAAVNRGERRALQSISIDLDDAERSGEGTQSDLEAFTGKRPEALAPDDVRALLRESGFWTALRCRPFGRVPGPDTTPHGIFVTAMDAHPHAPAVEVALAGREDDFRIGVECVAKLTHGKVYVCVAADSRLPVPDDARIAVERFAGPHPAGTPGLHIHLLDPVDHHKTVWHAGYQDVAAIGRLFATGRADFGRVVSLAGPGARRPRLLRTRIGASLDELAAGELQPGDQRIVSGSVLGGRTASGPVDGYLGRYHQQVSIVPEPRARELFGWIAPGAEKFSVWGVVLGSWLRGRRLALNTTTNGGPRAMVPIGSFEKVMPLDILPTFLLRALVTGDVERAEELGCLELDEEDLALCTFVCPGKTEYGPLLRAALNRIEKESAA